MRTYGDVELAILQTKNEINDLRVFIDKAINKELDPEKDVKLIIRVRKIYADYDRILKKFQWEEMKTEKQIREHYKMLKPLEMVLHPSLFITLEWILDEGNKDDQDFLFNMLKKQSDEYIKRNKDKKNKWVQIDL